MITFRFVLACVCLILSGMNIEVFINRMKFLNLFSGIASGVVGIWTLLRLYSQIIHH